MPSPIRAARFLAHSVGFVVLLLLSACQRAPASDRQAELLVLAAASTAEPLEETGKDFRQKAGTPVRFAFGASRDLARQIRAGIAADVFVSADAEIVDALVRDGFVNDADRRRIMSNRLVVIVPAAASIEIREPRDLTRAPRISMGDPSMVPAGSYARRWLESVGLWSELQAQVVPSLDVRAALAAVENGLAEAGIVYRTDARISTRVRIAYEVPAASTPEIAYVAASLARSQHAAALGFVQFLTEPAARAVFAHYGFVL